MKIEIDGERYITQREIEKKIKLKQTAMNTLVRFGLFPKPLKLEIRKLWKLTDVEEYLKKKRELEKEEEEEEEEEN